MRLASQRLRSIIIQVEELRAQFPALQRPVRLSQLQPVLPVLNVRLYRGPLAAEAAVIGARGSWVIGIRNDIGPRKISRILLHELGHVVLHGEGDEPERQLRPCLPGDPREAEAELFARLLYYGNEATPEHPAIAPVVAAITAYGMRRRLPPQIPLALPEPPRPSRASSTPRPAPVGRVHRSARLFSNARVADDENYRRVRYNSVRRATEFEDVGGRVWLVKDYRRAPAGSGRAYLRERDFMKPGILCRVFESPAGRHWLYRFPDVRERREHLVKHLDRQLGKATLMPVKAHDREPALVLASSKKYHRADARPLASVSDTESGSRR